MEFKENVLDRFRLDGKTAVVTGGTGNIGYHTALAFAQAGANIAVVDLPQCLERSQAVAAEFEGKYQVKAKGYGCDLLDEKAVGKMVWVIPRNSTPSAPEESWFCRSEITLSALNSLLATSMVRSPADASRGARPSKMMSRG